jgi:hypothetical protein
MTPTPDLYREYQRVSFSKERASSHYPAPTPASQIEEGICLLRGCESIYYLVGTPKGRLSKIAGTAMFFGMLGVSD